MFKKLILILLSLFVGQTFAADYAPIQAMEDRFDSERQTIKDQLNLTDDEVNELEFLIILLHGEWYARGIDAVSPESFVANDLPSYEIETNDNIIQALIRYYDEMHPEDLVV